MVDGVWWWVGGGEGWWVEFGTSGWVVVVVVGVRGGGCLVVVGGCGWCGGW